jgi:K+ transporter
MNNWLFEEKQKQDAIIKAQEEQYKQDEILLKTFATEDAIIRNRDDKIRSIEVLESITKDNVTRVKTQLIQSQKTAAQFERAGKLIPQNIMHTIEDSKRQIHENLNFLLTKSKEKDQPFSHIALKISRY